jgi:ATP-dependent Clp protease ATP-binding subunit ClpC
MKFLFLSIIMLFQNINHNSSVQVITLDMGLLVAGTKYRGEFEERLKKLMEEIKQNDDIILFIDEVHTLIGAGAAEGAIDAANILKPALARGELQVMCMILNSIAAIVMLLTCLV